MAGILAGHRLPELGASARELVDAAELFAFEGQPSELLHPEVNREELFPDKKVMPVRELLFDDRCAAVGMIISVSLMRTYIDTTHDLDRITKVRNPGAYAALLQTGERIGNLKDRHKPLLDESDYEPDRIEPLMIAGAVYNDFSNALGQKPGSMKHLVTVIKNAEPKLRKDETLADRQNSNIREQERRLFRWRYGRTLGLAVASGAFAVASLWSAHTTEPEFAHNEVVVEVEQNTMYSQPLSESEMKKDNAKWFGIVSAVALCRFGYWRLQRPRGQEA